ncbi:MAG: hypothetical protein U5K00_05065 [Melioribacteraceae bacterium]|nr:hypothetical protein [Melioribacteraceae bacterium]
MKKNGYQYPDIRCKDRKTVSSNNGVSMMQMEIELEEKFGKELDGKIFHEYPEIIKESMVI